MINALYHIRCIRVIIHAWCNILNFDTLMISYLSIWILKHLSILFTTLSPDIGHTAAGHNGVVGWLLPLLCHLGSRFTYRYIDHRCGFHCQIHSIPILIFIDVYVVALEVRFVSKSLVIHILRNVSIVMYLIFHYDFNISLTNFLENFFIDCQHGHIHQSFGMHITTNRWYKAILSHRIWLIFLSDVTQIHDIFLSNCSFISVSGAYS